MCRVNGIAVDPSEVLVFGKIRRVERDTAARISAECISESHVPIDLVCTFSSGAETG